MTLPKEEINDPWDMHRELESVFSRFTMAYLNGHPSAVADPEQFASASQRLVDLRNSVLYRFESLAYHVDLIRRREQQCFSAFQEDPFRRDGLEVVRWGSRDMKFLLDDIVFSAISLFDYFGNLTGFALLDEASRNIKWNGVLKWPASDVAQPGTVLRSRGLNDEWIDGLAMYRNSLIHASSDTSGGAKTHRFGGGMATTEIRITAPRALIERIEYLRTTVPPEGLLVVATALWIVGQTFDTIVELCDLLAKDLTAMRDHT